MTSKMKSTVTNKPVKSKSNIVLFPKGPSPVKGVFDIEFGALVNLPSCVVARYKVLPTDSNKYKDMVRDLKPGFGRNFSIIPGIKSVFVVPRATNCLEYAITVDVDKAQTYFQTAVDLKSKDESVLSIDFIKNLMKVHIARFHKF